MQAFRHFLKQTKHQNIVFRASLYQLQQRKIYIKDKDLDKSQYKPSEADYIRQYVANHMKDDPRQLSQEEQQKLAKEAELLKQQSLLENQQERINMQNQEKLNSSDSLNNSQNEQERVKVISPDKIKMIFDKITEIDTNPEGKSAQEFYKKVEEIEKNNTNKKKSSIIIKTLKRGKNVQNVQYDMSGGVGKQISQEQLQYEKKFIDFTKYTFPEKDQFVINENGKTIKLASYRYPAKDQANKKGLVYYMHGYGDYVGRYAYFAQYFSEAGYDFLGIDQRGFGHSEGRRGIIESEDVMINDQLKYIDHCDKLYGGKDVNKYLLGYSLGAIISTKLTIQRPNYFKAQGLLTPYLRLKNHEMLQKFAGVARFLHRIYPTFKLAQFPVKKGEEPKAHITHFLKDPLCEFAKIPVHNIVLNDSMLKKFVENDQDKVITPMIMILAGKDHDNVICNKTAKNFFEMAPIEDKAIVQYNDLDHMVIHDNQYVSLIARDLIGFFNTH